MEDLAAVLVRGVPHLSAVERAAVAADELAVESLVGVCATECFPAGELVLDGVPVLRGDDRLVAALDQVLRHFARVRFELLFQEVGGIGLLEKGVPAVLLVGEDAPDCRRAPRPLSCGRRNVMCHQIIADALGRPTLQEQLVDDPDDLRLFGNDLQRLVAVALFITEEVGVSEAEPPVGEPFALTPCDVLADGPGFFLRQGTHDREQQFALAIKGVDVFLLEEALHAFLFELSDGHQAVDRVAGEAGNALRNDEVDLAVHRVPDHGIETVAVLGAEGRDPFVGVDAGELPVAPAFDITGVVVYLRLVACELFVAVRGHPRISGDPSLRDAALRQGGELVFGGGYGSYSRHRFAFLSLVLSPAAFRISGVQLSERERSFHNLSASVPSARVNTRRFPP